MNEADHGIIEKIEGNSRGLLITLDDGTFLGYYTEGDCCSYTEVDSFLGADKLIGSKFIRVEADEWAGGPMPESEEEEKEGEAWVGGELIQYYGLKFIAGHPVFGEVTAIANYRNFSNGYYGGWMDGGPVEYDRHRDWLTTETYSYMRTPTVNNALPLFNLTQDVHQMGADDV